MSKILNALETAKAGTEQPLAELLDALPWNSAGLLPAIAQDQASGEVLMMAWMNRDALEESLASGQVCYWSRSRQQLWRKGETSGHQQALRTMHLDCDGDTLLLQVAQTGPACHTNRRSCFYIQLEQDKATVDAAKL